MNLVKRNTIEWKLLIRKLSFSKLKSNRDYLCLKCWLVFTYEQVKNHRDTQTSHSESIITSKHFTSEEKFTSICK